MKLTLFSRLFWALVVVLLPTLSLADNLAEVKGRGELVWGGDAEGGGPYIYEDPNDPSKQIGYDIVFAEALAKQLGVKPKFFQGGWDKMPTFLDAKQIDIITNGYEYTEERAAVMEASIPYYVYGLQMMVRKDETRVKDWEAFKSQVDGRKWKIGVLGDSAAEYYLKDTFKDTVEVVNYDDNTTAMKDVIEKTLDVTVADTPIVRFFEPRFPELRITGPAVAKGYYVIYARKGETALIQEINKAILALIDSGEISKVYTPYKMWDEQIGQELRCTAKLASKMMAQKGFGLSALAEVCDFGAQGGLVGSTATPASTPSSQTSSQPVEDLTAPSVTKGFDVVTKYGPILLLAAKNTIILSLFSFPVAILLGLLVAMGRMYGPVWLRVPLTVYVEFIRGTPLMLQLFIIYFFFMPGIMSLLGIDPTSSLGDVPVKSLLASLIGLAINYGAYESEMYRSGLQAIPIGQMEAALSLGMTKGMALRRVIVPQALRITIPPTVNDFIALFKDTSVCSVIAVVELTKAYSINSKNNPQAFLEFVAITSLLYLAMSYPMSLLSRRLEKKLAREA